MEDSVWVVMSSKGIPVRMNFFLSCVDEQSANKQNRYRYRGTRRFFSGARGYLKIQLRRYGNAQASFIRYRNTYIVQALY